MRPIALAKLRLDLRASLWLQPLVLLVLGATLGALAGPLERWLLASGLTDDFIAGASPGGTRELLSVAAGALVTTLAVSFSLTMVTVQLASSQYSPRLVRRFLADRFMQRLLGAFLGTIAYLFLVLRAVRSPEEGPSFVPVVSSVIALILTVGCLGFLVVFLHHTMRGMQASTIVADVGRATLRGIRGLDHDVQRLEHEPSGRAHVIHAEAIGYVQLVSEEQLDEVVDGPVVIRREVSPGDFVFHGVPLMTVFAETLDEHVAAALRDTFAVGRERTWEQDILFGVRQLVDIALKALSPGINDITTAVMVVNELGAIAREVAEHAPVEDGWFVRECGDVTLLKRVLTLERCLHLAFDEIVDAGHGHPQLYRRLTQIVEQIAAADGSTEVAACLRAYADRWRDQLTSS